MGRIYRIQLFLSPRINFANITSCFFCAKVFFAAFFTLTVWLSKFSVNPYPNLDPVYDSHRMINNFLCDKKIVP